MRVLWLRMRPTKPWPVTLNHCWGIDLTGRADAAGYVHTILDITDHGSRLAVRLARILHKCLALNHVTCVSTLAPVAIHISIHQISSSGDQTHAGR